MKLILIEGIPGSGKSTFARFLSNQLERNGYACRLYLESTFEHPIIDVQGNKDVESYSETFMQKWGNWLDVISQDNEIVVMESAFLQNPIVHMLHKDTERERIKSLIHRVGDRVNQIECELIYFYQLNALTAIHKMIEIRGGADYLLRKHNEYKDEPFFVDRLEQGPDAHLEFFLEYSLLANQIVRELTIQTEVIENSSADYELYQTQVLNKYNLKFVADPILETSVLQSYSGLYHCKEMALSLSVELVEDSLWIFGNKRLRPKGMGQFYLDDMSVLVSFIVENTTVTGLVITEKDFYANRSDSGTVFERISLS